MEPSQEQAEEIGQTFTLTVTETHKIEAWLLQHQAGDECPLKKNLCPITNEPFYMGAIGGGLTYTFTPTGLGVVTRVHCACGKDIDVTDYDSW